MSRFSKMDYIFLACEIRLPRRLPKLLNRHLKTIYLVLRVYIYMEFDMIFTFHIFIGRYLSYYFFYGASPGILRLVTKPNYIFLLNFMWH